MSDNNPLNIILDKNSATYSPGEAITGRLILTLAQGIKTNGVRLSFYGGAYVRWTTTRQVSNGKGGTRSHTVTHSQSETFIDQHFYVIRKQGNQQVQIPPGHREFPFSFQLPLGVPTSLEARYGHVRYSVTAKIEKSWWKSDPTCSIPVPVFGILDLNDYPETQWAVQCVGSKYICCLCCKDGPISFVLNLTKAGYVPGEALNFVMEMNNQSNKVISNVYVRLDLRLHFRAWGNSRFLHDTVAVFTGPELGAHETKIWRSDPLKYVIPSTPPTNLGGGKIIGLEYTLQVELVIPGAINLGGSTGILIGTIPFGKISVAPSVQWPRPPFT